MEFLWWKWKKLENGPFPPTITLFAAPIYRTGLTRCLQRLSFRVLFLISRALFCYDFPMTAFRRPNMLDKLCFLHLIQLLLDAIRRDADDLGKLFASSKRMLANFVKNHFLGTLVRFLGTFLGTTRVFLGSSRIFFLVFLWLIRTIDKRELNFFATVHPLAKDLIDSSFLLDSLKRSYWLSYKYRCATLAFA